MTAIERRAGRFLRAPDHDAGTGGGGDAGASGAAAGGAAAGDAGAGDAAAAAAASGADGSAGGEGAGAAASDDGAGSGADQGAAAADEGGGDDGTALGGAAKQDGEGDEGAAAEHVVPESYELTAPDGMTIDQGLLEEATPVFKGIGLSNDQANKILPVAKSLMDKTRDNTLQGVIDAGNQQRKAWLDEAKADAEIGGKNWDGSLHSAAKALDALGHPEGSPFRQALNETGFGNHPEFIRIFAGLGTRIGEDGDFVRGDASAKVNVPLEKRLYPND